MEAAVTPISPPLESFSPFDGARLGAVDTVRPEHVQDVVDDVASVQPFWAQLPLHDRARYMRRAGQAIIDQLDDLAALLAREQGKPINEAYAMDLVPTIDSLRWLAEAGPLHLRAARRGRRHRALELPLVDPVRRGGGRADGGQRGGAQAGLAHPADRPAHTGGVRASRGAGGPRAHGARRWRGRPGAGGVERGDANLPNAISGCVWGGFANAGQTCSGIERVYVVEEVAERFVEGVVEGAERLRTGDPLEWDTEIGPMVSPEQLAQVRELVDDAVANGATLHCGGAEEPFFRPAVLTGVRHDMRLMREEIFGPVVPIVTVESEDEAIALANDSEFGLGASVWTMNRAKGERIAGRLQSGMVWINDHMFSHGVCSCSWGGVKDSGLGRSHSKFGLWECVNIKLVTWEPSRTRDFWWYPYDERLGKALNASAKLLYGRDSDKPGALRRGLLPMLRVSARTLRRKA